MNAQRIVGLAAIWMLVSTAAWAQSGAITGTLTDPSGAVLPGVSVEAASPALIEQTRTVTTDGIGVYTILDLRPGAYTLTFTLVGFQTVKRENVLLTTGFTATVNAQLPIGSVGEAITVTVESPVVDTVNTRVQTVIDRALIEALPVAKNMGAFGALIPGATPAQQDVGGSANETGQTFAIHGGRGSDFQQFRDGMNSNSLLAAGNILSSENPSMMQEVVVETGGFDPVAQTGGGHINLVTKDGGNTFAGSMRLDFSTREMQSVNLNDALRLRGATTPGDIRDRHDYNGAFGGPIAKNKVWFIVGFRTWMTSTYQVNNYYNKTQGTLFYNADASQPAYSLDSYRTADVRVTWQATTKNKFTAMVSPESNCSCFFGLNGNTSPEAAGSHHLWPEYRMQTTWTYPMTSRLLLWAGGTYQYTDLERFPEGAGNEADRSVLELSNNYRYGAAGSQLATPGGSWGFQKSKQINQNFTVSYLLGRHTFQAGLNTMQGIQAKVSRIADSLSFRFRNQLPQSIDLWATPYNWDQRVDYYAAFAGDQWRVGKLTLNLGVRYDAENGSVPAQHLAAGPYVPERDFEAQSGIPRFHDLNPRLGAAYDPFGDGRTAIKASLSRNVLFDPPGGIVQQNNPVNLMVITANRTWSDANGDFVPQPSELSGLSNTAFGTVVRTTSFSDAVINGWAVRAYNWSGSVTVQHELRPGLSVNAGYFRTWYGNFTATDNLAVGPQDYDEYCITSPADEGRLPGGGGQRICGLYDIKPTKFGQINNLVVPASTFGNRTEVFNGIDATITVRRRGYFVSGGLSTGSTTTDSCFAVDSPQALYQCHVTPPWSAATQLKFQAVAPLPRGVQLSANFQMLPSIGQLANFTVTSAMLRESIGRNFASGANGTATVPLIAPGTVYAEGWNRQVDFRVTRAFRANRLSVQPAFDLYNLLNASPVLATQNAWGGQWNNVTSLLGARVMKLGVLVKF